MCQSMFRGYEARARVVLASESYRRVLYWASLVGGMLGGGGPSHMLWPCSSYKSRHLPLSTLFHLPAADPNATTGAALLHLLKSIESRVETTTGVSSSSVPAAGLSSSLSANRTSTDLSIVHASGESNVLSSTSVFAAPSILSPPLYAAT